MKHYRAEPASQPATDTPPLTLLPLPATASGTPHPSLQVAAAPQTSAQSCDWRRRSQVFCKVSLIGGDEVVVFRQVSVITACEAP
ncbi:hypothetical protein E2C01_026931 [Portunus trituberculatus]|uniref:Uncharacterized protein n=1 Tax=Portunus trituberculatus TaxID=210409 RepID=A0A5B7EK57_PORTR|nr:hypothetical protein [Portunus trituberculatus]